MSPASAIHRSSNPFPPATIEGFLGPDLAPQAGENADALLNDIAARVLPYPFGNGHPRFYAWVNPPSTPIGIFGDAIAAAMNPSCAGGNHAAIYVEHQVLNWVKDIIGFPREAGGLLVSGGSMATLNALTVARYVKAGFDVRNEGMVGALQPLTVYVTSEGHSAIQKAIEMLGIGKRYLRMVPIDAQRRMVVSDLVRMIAEDRAAGMRPIAVVANAGSASTGVIDNMARGYLVPCRWRLRGTGDSLGTISAAIGGTGAGRQRRARSTQMDVCSGRNRTGAVKGCRGNAAGIQPRSGLSAFGNCTDRC